MAADRDERHVAARAEAHFQRALGRR
ncbi:MAG: hypothetical protein JWR42_1103, partial [Marmoricola sp.]|nr:hypothetical protein [Marmoricola sp.]